VPVLGLEKYLKVEVSTGKSIILNLRPAWGDPGRYFADIMPTVLVGRIACNDPYASDGCGVCCRA
jgi:hypothetical protein